MENCMMKSVMSFQFMIEGIDGRTTNTDSHAILNGNPFAFTNVSVTQA